MNKKKFMFFLNKMFKYKVFVSIFILIGVLNVVCSQEENYVYDRTGNKIKYVKEKNIFHIGFNENFTEQNKDRLLSELSKYSLTSNPLGSDTYRFVLCEEDVVNFEEFALNCNYIFFCQNEYRDTLSSLVWPTNRLMVKMKHGNSIDNLFPSINSQILQYESKWYDSTIYTLIIPKESNIFSLSNRIYESGLVEYAQPSFHHYSVLDGYETNPKFVDQWNIRDTTMSDTGDTTLCRLGANVVRAWKFTTGSPEVHIAIFDDGVEETHEDLARNFLFEKNYSGVTLSNMVDAKGHGTPCCGIISSTNNDTGIVGIAHNCRYVSFITHCDSIQTRDIVPHPHDSIIHVFSEELFEEAVHYACDSANISIFSCSWHVDGILLEPFLSAIDYATLYGRKGKGCVFVFSSGNNYGPDSLVKPTAKLSDVLAVGGTSSTGFRAGWEVPDGEMVSSIWESCYGDSLDLMAPGELVWTTCNVSDSCYGGNFEGTSAAAPHVAGVAALVLSMDTNLTYRQVFEILCSSATKVRPEYYTYSNNPSYPYGA